MQKSKLSKYLMLAAIAVIAMFQLYWLQNLYKSEYASIQKQADVLLKQSVHELREATIKSNSDLAKYLGKNSIVEKSNNASTGNKVFKEIRNITSNQKKTVDTVTQKVIKETIKLDTIKSLQIVNIYSSNKMDVSFRDSILQHINPENIKSISFITDTNNVLKRKVIADSVSNKSSVINRQPASVSIRPVMVFRKIGNDSVKINGNGKTTSSFTFSDTNNLNFKSFIVKIFIDSIAPNRVDSAFKKSLSKQKVEIPYKLVAKRVVNDSVNIIDTTKKTLHTTAATIGLDRPMAYQAQFENPFWFIVKRLYTPILFSILLLSFVSLAFIFLYRNLVAQEKIALLKNDFISNITHELKTPIATVRVALEALKNFNALNDTKKTNDYLDISTLEMNRLSMLVDNVLKISMFENKSINIHYENFDIVALTKEVVNALSIQSSGIQATVTIDTAFESIFLYADKLHVSSLLFNLIDNAIKYSNKNCFVNIILQQINNQVIIRVKDNGIGISKIEQQKIFSKFYRVQTGDVHNTKGYGLGLSYVKYIVEQHNGKIKVISELNKGSEFIVELPILKLDNSC